MDDETKKVEQMWNDLINMRYEYCIGVSKNVGSEPAIRILYDDACERLDRLVNALVKRDKG